MNTMDNMQTLVGQIERAAHTVHLPPEGYEAGRPAVLIPQGYTLGYLNFTPLQPSRVEASFEAKSQESFVRYVQDHKLPTTAIFASMTDHDCRFLAIIDYHGVPVDGQPQAAYCSHTVGFTPELSPSWKDWSEKSNQFISQESLALFLEDHLPDVVTPEGATLLGIINTLEVNASATFSRAQRLADGTVKFHFVQDQDAKSGDVKLPETLAVRFPVFEWEPESAINVRLRYRLDPKGAVLFKLQVVNPHLVLRAAFRALYSRVATGTGINPYVGQSMSK